MDKNTKTLLTIGGVAVLGYILYKQFGSKSFANAIGTARFSAGIYYCSDGTRKELTRSSSTNPCSNHGGVSSSQIYF
jgi:hypothetical protein